MAAPAPIITPAHFTMLHIDNVVESKSNPRKSFGDMAELEASVREKGVLSPVKARPVNGHFELVYGARRLRAAKKAGLTEIPALVQDMDDKAVIEEQLVENSQRIDVPPLEEAEGYRELIEKHGYAVDDLAARVGKSRRTIYERLQLCKLGKEGKKALDEDRLSASVAILIARIPAELQAQAVKDVARDGADDAGLSYRAAVDHIHRNFMLALKDAPFSTTDAGLVAKAGACSACPKRTGNQPELFADVKAKDVCTDPACYKSKEDALWQIKVKEAEGKGQKVLSDKEAARHFPEYNRGEIQSQTYADLDQKWWVKDKHVEVRKLVGNDAPPPVLARDRDGKIHELVPRAVADKARAKAEPPAPRGTADPQAKKQAEEAKRRWAIVRATSAAVLDKAQKKGPDAIFWRVLIGGLTVGSWHDALREVVKAREWKEEKASPEEAIREGMLKLKDDELPVLALQIVIAKGGASYFGDVLGVALKQAAKSYGVDVDKIKDQVKEAAKEKKAAKAKPDITCAIPGCGEPGKRVKGSPGLWCKSHSEKLSASERKSIDDRNKRLAAEGKLPAPAKKKGGKAARKR